MALSHEQAREMVKEANLYTFAHDNSLAAVQEQVEKNPQLIEALNAIDASVVDETPQGAAAHSWSKEVLEYMLAKGVKLDIFMACALGRTDQVAEFLSNDPSLIKATGSHKIPLMSHAADKATAELLLAHGAKLNAKERATLLHRAATTGQRDFGEWLIERGANVNVPGRRGKTPLFFALENGHQDTADLLRQHGATT